METLVAFLLLIGVGLVPVGIMLVIRYFSKKRNLDERYPEGDPYQEPDYRKYSGRRRR
jgi:hypothetical protein